MVAEEGQVELVDGHGRVAHALHPDVRQVDVHVPAEEAGGLGEVGVELLEVVEALAHVAVAPAEARCRCSHVNC